jgi:hypothetical protein
MSREEWRAAAAEHAKAQRRQSRYSRLPPQITGVGVARPPEAQAVLDGTGEHADHERVTIGIFTECSCGMRVLGKPKEG